jgi:hypothetical protein
MTDPNANTIERAQDLGQSPEAVARRWKLELKLADKRERDWRKKAADIYKLYTPDTPAANSFNVLWTNTETLRQSVYNSLPQPDARRRYQDADPLGQAVGEVLTRALEFSQDTYDFDGLLQDDVLAMLLAGRAVSRVRYVPDIRTTPAEPAEADTEADTYEEIAWEQAICERVQYDDFRILGAAKCWNDVPAIGLRHRMTRQDCIDKFGDEIGNAIKLDAVDDEDVKNARDDADLFKTAEVWEIWDKTEKQVIWINASYPRPCKMQDDPLGLTGFFPVPRPLYAIQNDQSLVPACLYTQYEQQAKELNRISMRINKLVDALRVRGIYDATLGELSQLMKSGDNELVPSQSVTTLLDRGGLEKAIWMMPIEIAAAVLKELYAQRDATKQIIYEITGISDIMRSASDPAETFGAQKIKTQWGTQRLQRMQKEVQRYTRDLVRLKAEVISAKFQPETLQQMTLVDLPHQAEVDQQKQMATLQYQQAAQQAMQTGKQPPPSPQQQPDPITWEAVVQAMRNDATRTYRIDIETDSTLSATQDSDMEGLKEVLTGLSQIMQGFGPAVQQGAMSVEVLKELMLVVTRRARMGTAIEDVIAKIEQPPKPADPNAGQMQIEQQKMQFTAQLEQMKAQLADQQNQRQLQFDQQRAQMEAQVSMQAEAHKQQMQAAQVEQQNQIEAQRAHLQMQNEAALEQMRIASDERMKGMEQQMQVLLAHINNAAKIEVAEIAAGTTLEAAQISAAKQSEGD